jgi:hypothetical protein
MWVAIVALPHLWEHWLMSSYDKLANELTVPLTVLGKDLASAQPPIVGLQSSLAFQTAAVILL